MFVRLLLLLLPAILFAYTPFSMNMTIDKQNPNSGKLLITVTNFSAEDVKLLKWKTPFETELSANIFDVYIGKEHIAYRGRVVKRGAPKEEDYILFHAAEEKTISVDLPQYYKMLKEGNYTVAYQGELDYKKIQNTKVKTPKILKHSINSVSFYYIPTQKKTLYLRKKPANFNACDQSNITTLNSAHDEAISLSSEALSALNAAPSNTSGERYVTWFGVANATGQATVTEHFTNIYTALDTQDIAFDCNCTDNSFAYVYADQPYTIYLCNAFWTANLSGTDSQAGTIIHEMSHFTVLAGTDDFAYGHTDAKSLANTDPQKAIFNADNHEYFAENTPFLSMDNFFDTAVSIDDIDSDLPLTEAIDSVGEKDLYTFIAPDSRVYTFFTTGSLDTIGTLYDSAQNQLENNDDASTSERNFSLQHTLIAGQRYYLAVQAYGDDVGGYTLEMSAGKSLAEFVERFYVTILGRASDSEGSAYWVQELIKGTKAASDIAKGFINSAEFDIDNKDNTTYVTVLYQAFFNRPPDNDGLNYWLGELASGMTKDKVLDGFLGSQEFSTLAKEYGIKVKLTDIEQFVIRFYEQCLLRTPEIEGLQYWASLLSNGTKSGADVARGFVLSLEFKNRHLDKEAYVRVLYKAFFARDADTPGLNHWLTLLNGGVSRESVLNGFLKSTEFINLAKRYGIKAN